MSMQTAYTTSALTVLSTLVKVSIWSCRATMWLHASQRSRVMHALSSVWRNDRSAKSVSSMSVNLILPLQASWRRRGGCGTARGTARTPQVSYIDMGRDILLLQDLLDLGRVMAGWPGAAGGGVDVGQWGWEVRGVVCCQPDRERYWAHNRNMFVSFLSLV